MKTIIKSKRCYRNKIGRPTQELADQANNSGTQGGKTSNNDHGESDAISSDDEGKGGSKGSSIELSSDEDNLGEGTSAGTKRKATGNGGKGGKGKQRKL